MTIAVHSRLEPLIAVSFVKVMYAGTRGAFQNEVFFIVAKYDGYLILLGHIAIVDMSFVFVVIKLLV